jgi:hypothetical protein
VRFFGAIQEALARGRGLLFAHQSGRESLFDKALTDVAHRMAMTVQGCSYGLIGPGGAMSVHVEQDVGMLDLRADIEHP